jgi:hypothetical protein
MAVPIATMAVDTAFWFFTVQHQSVGDPVQMLPWVNCGVAATQVPPTIAVPAGHDAVHDDCAPPPLTDGPVHVT